MKKKKAKENNIYLNIFIIWTILIISFFLLQTSHFYSSFSPAKTIKIITFGYFTPLAIIMAFFSFYISLVSLIKKQLQLNGFLFSIFNYYSLTSIIFIFWILFNLQVNKLDIFSIATISLYLVIFIIINYYLFLKHKKFFLAIYQFKVIFSYPKIKQMILIYLEENNELGVPLLIKPEKEADYFKFIIHLNFAKIFFWFAYAFIVPLFFAISKDIIWKIFAIYEPILLFSNWTRQKWNIFFINLLDQEDRPKIFFNKWIFFDQIHEMILSLGLIVYLILKISLANPLFWISIIQLILLLFLKLTIVIFSHHNQYVKSFFRKSKEKNI